MKRYFQALFLISSLFSFATQAADNDPFAFDLGSDTAKTTLWAWDGFLSSRNRYASERSDWLSNRLRLQLEGRYQGEGWRLFTNGYADYDPTLSDYDDSYQLQEHEAYLLVEGTAFDLTVGKKRIAWGVADGRSTIDRVNALDLSDPISDGRTSARIPSWLLAAERETSLGVWQAVWLPFGREQRLPRFGSPWETAPLNALRLEAQRGNIDLQIEQPRGHESGLCFTRYTTDLDWGLAVFEGYTDMPLVQHNNGNQVSLHPARIRTWNTNATLNLGESTLRAELSVTPHHPFNGAQQTLTQLITGWDRTYSDELYLNLQAYIDYFDAEQKDYGMTFVLSKPFFDNDLDAGVRGQVANRAQYAMEFFADYTLDDHFSVHFKMMGFGGDPDSALGAYQDNDFAELMLRYDF